MVGNDDKSMTRNDPGGVQMERVEKIFSITFLIGMMIIIVGVILKIGIFHNPLFGFSIGLGCAVLAFLIELNFRAVEYKVFAESEIKNLFG